MLYFGWSGWESSNCGGGLGFGIGGSDREGSGFCLCGGIWFIVFCPTVMKWWLRQFAIEVSFVCVLFSYSMMEGEMVGVLFCGRCLFIVCHIFLGLL